MRWPETCSDKYRRKLSLVKTSLFFVSRFAAVMSTAGQ